MEWHREKPRFPFGNCIGIVFLLTVVLALLITEAEHIKGESHQVRSRAETAVQWTFFCLWVVVPLLSLGTRLINRYRWGQAKMTFSSLKPHANRLTSYHAWSSTGYFSPKLIRLFLGVVGIELLFLLIAGPMSLAPLLIGLTCVSILVFHLLRKAQDHVLIVGNEGVRIRKLLRYHFIPWDALARVEVELRSIGKQSQFEALAIFVETSGKRHRVLAFPDNKDAIYRLTSLCKQLFTDHEGIQYGGKWLMDWSEALRLPTPTHLDPIEPAPA